MPFIALALVVAAALGGGAASISRDALPGDFLWNFKTAVTENLQGMLARGDEARARWDIAAAQARLDEAGELLAAGRLDAAAQAGLTANFNAHAGEATAIVQKLQAAGNAQAAADIAARFEAVLAQNAAALAQRQQASAAPAESDNFLDVVRGTLNAAANLTANASAAI